MKRALICLCLLGFWVGVAQAASVTVTNPANGVTWVKGQTYLITWTKDGDMPPGVKISLRNQSSTSEVLLIADPAPNSGSYQWTVPASVPDGSYHIRVKVKNVDIHDDSEIFNIAASAPPPPAPSITVTKPTTGDKWNRTKTYTITWDKDGDMPGTVKIDLINQAATAVVKPIADGVANSGSRSWTVPADVPFDQYRVRVQVKTTTIQDDSEVFSISVIQIPGAKAISKVQTVKTYTVPAINILNLSCMEGSPISGMSKCGVWQNVYPIFQARPTCMAQVADKQNTAMVGADHFTYNWWDPPVPITAYKAFRSRLGFDVSAFMGKGEQITEAKLHMTQIASVRSNTSDASCGVSWWFMTANPVQSGEGWVNVPIDSSCHGSLNWWQSEYSVDVSCAVQRWVSGSHPNFGIILISRWEGMTSEIWTCISCFDAELIIKVKE